MRTFTLALLIDQLSHTPSNHTCMILDTIVIEMPWSNQELCRTMLAVFSIETRMADREIKDKICPRLLKRILHQRYDIDQARWEQNLR